MRSVRSRTARLATLGLALVLGAGCVSTHCFAREGTDVRLRIPAAAAAPGRWLVVVADHAGPGAQPDAAGRVELAVPGTKFCERRFLGIVTQASTDPLASPRILVQRDGLTVREFTLADIGRLPRDEYDWPVLDA